MGWILRGTLRWCGLALILIVTLSILENGWSFAITLMGIVSGGFFGICCAILALHIVDYGWKNGIVFSIERLWCIGKALVLGFREDFRSGTIDNYTPTLLANEELAKPNPDNERVEYNYCRDITFDPVNVSAWSGLAEMRRRSNKFSQALGAIDIAILIGHDDKTYNGLGQLWILKARILREDQRLKEAQKVLIENRVEQLNPYSQYVKLVLESNK